MEGTIRCPTVSVDGSCVQRCVRVCVCARQGLEKDKKNVRPASERVPVCDACISTCRVVAFRLGTGIVQSLQVLQTSLLS